MRPWKIVLSAAIAAVCVAVVLLRPALSAVPPAGLVPLLLPRLPALALILIAVYALVAILFGAGGLIAIAIALRRRLDRTDAASEAAAALDWIAAFDATVLRAVVPRLVGALPKSAARSTTILLSTRFDPREARSEVAHVYYIWLARTHALGALVGLAAIGALGFAQDQGGVRLLPGNIPTGATVLVLTGFLLLVGLARLAIDVTVDPLIEAMSRLPWEQVDAGRLRYAVDLLETARIEAVTSGRSVAGIPNGVPERLAAALEDGNRALSAAGERLSAAADAIGIMTRSAIDALETRFPDSAPPDGDGAGEARIAALQAAVEALTAALYQGAGAERLAAGFEEDRRAVGDAVERLSTAADAIGAMARSAIDALEASLRETAPTTRNGTEPGGAGAAQSAALQAAVEALTAELRQFAAVVGAAREASANTGRAVAAPELGHELRRLLEDIELEPRRD
jgi:hypothetical protein